MSENDILSPEEKLDTLERLLLTDKSKAHEFFARNSQGNHELVLNNLLEYPYTIRRTEDYIILMSRVGGDTRVSIIGLDDNYNFFCHVLPQLSDDEIRSLDINPTDDLIRRLMGFDKHIWEITECGISPGLSVRAQGDVVVRFERIFDDEDELYAELFAVIINKILSSIFPRIANQNIFNTLTTRVSGIILNYLRVSGEWDSTRLARLLDQTYRGYIPNFSLEMPRGPLSSNPPVRLGILRKAVEFTEEILDILPEYERIIIGRIGRHEVRIVGVRDRSLNVAINSVVGALRITHIAGDTIYVLRPTTITFIHPEHKSVMLDIPRSIIRIDTLRGMNVRTILYGIMPLIRVKVMILGSDSKTSFIRRIFNGFTIEYKSTVGADFYVYTTRTTFTFGPTLLEFLIWDISTSPIFDCQRPLYYRGARAAIFFFDVTDKESFLKLPDIINEFWRYSGGTWPIAIIGDTSNTNSKKREVPREIAEKYVQRLSEALGFEVPYVELRIDQANRLTDIFVTIARILSNHIYRPLILRRGRRNDQ